MAHRVLKSGAETCHRGYFETERAPEPYQEEAAELLAAFEARPTHDLLANAAQLRDAGHGRIITYSRKVFIPLTRLCRDVCGYCTFATTPHRIPAAYLGPDEVLAIARAGQAAGCREALFTLGDKPELRYAAARRALQELGFESTWEYLAAMCDLVIRETGLLPHVNAGVMSEYEIGVLRGVSVSQGIMLENVSSRLCDPGGPHFGSPDKRPEIRLEMIAAAGRQRVPFTSGILIGIGETRAERVQSLLALRNLHAKHSHLQEVIIQNFRAKPGTRMSESAEPTLEDLMWTAAVARHILGPAANIQVPPNLSYGEYPKLLAAGINDWGGVSPVTVDHVNPEAPWPHLDRLERATEEHGFALAQRLAVYPEYALDSLSWQTAGMAKRVLSEIDSLGLARTDAWAVGRDGVPPRGVRRPGRSSNLDAILRRSERGDGLQQDEIVRLFSGWGSEVDEICDAADRLRRSACGDVVGYVVNRNINYTNVCSYHCQFCAFSKGKLGGSLRGPAYDLSLDEIARRSTEAWARGATEVCMQGGINPGYTGETYLEIVRSVKSAVPGMHVHAFSPLEVSQGAATLGITVPRFLERLQRAGLGTLPGTAAEILDDEVRAILCPDKLSTREWIDVVESAHRVGLKTTATIMFGHVERPRSWARHLLELRDLQARTGGLTEIVPLPFVHMEAPIYLKGRARKGPTWRECLLMHAVARLALHPLITNVQGSWVKLSPAGAATMLRAGANDLGGTLMNESISRAAGTRHGQEFAPEQMEDLIVSAGRVPRQRTTLYQGAAAERRACSLGAAALTEPVFTPLLRKRSAHVH
jgi:FO synthase